MKMLFTIMVLSALLVTGCGGNGSGTGQNPNERYFINGIPAKAYFEKFLYRYEANEPLPYYYLASQSVFLKKVSENKNLFATISLYLKANGEYTLDYDEAVGNIGGGIVTTTPEAEQRLKGQWSVEKNRLILTGLGIGSGINYNDVDSVEFQFDRAIHDSSLVFKTVILSPVRSTSGM